MQRIVGLVGDDEACTQWRITQPLNKINALRLAETQVCNGLEPDIDEIIEKADVVIFGRAASEKIIHMVNKLQEMGKKVVFDLDDSLFHVSPFNQSYKTLGVLPYDLMTESGEKIEMWRDGKNEFNIRNNRNFINYFIQVLKKVDLVTVSTEPLKDLYKNFNTEVIVIPNSINMSIWSPKFNCNNKINGEIRVLCTQAANHYEHMLWMIPILAEIQRKYSGVRILFVGTDWKMIKSDLDYTRVDVLPWVSFDAYPYLLKSLNADICVAPLDDCFFDSCRSAIKYYESASLQIPLVASNCGPYKREIVNGETGFIVDDKEEWINRLSGLIEDRSLRLKIANCAYKDVIDNHNLDYVVEEWMKVFNESL